MRILIVTHAPLEAEFGASQIALNLGEALRVHGHDVTVWSPQPLPQNIQWWQTIRRMRSRFDQFLRSQNRFDIIDCPSTLITSHASRSAAVIARSIQPDLLYLSSDLTSPKWREFKRLGYVPFEYLYTIYLATLVLRGWSRARWICCLGGLELKWMRRWFPWWRNKLTSYFIAPSGEDRLALAAVHRSRLPREGDQLRFLWIGRWVAHKGRRDLLEFITNWSIGRPQDTFTIAGCGPGTEKDCPAVLLRSGIIKVVPHFSRCELPELLRQHHIGLFTSRIEGWGLSLNEMLESGMPVFATEAGGALDLKEFFKEEVREFPPTPNSVWSCNSNFVLPESYLNQFSWQNIAAKYLQCLSPEPLVTPLPSEPEYSQPTS